MEFPGSNPDIPESAEIIFNERWDRANPGTKKIFGVLQINGRKLVVFPHREWEAPLDTPVKCVLYPVKNAAIAAPFGGIPTEEKIEAVTTK